MTEPATGDGGESQRTLSTFLSLGGEDRAEWLRTLAEPESELRRLGDDAERAAASTPEAALVGAEAIVDAARSLGLAGAEARATRAKVLAMAYLGRLEPAVVAAMETRRFAAERGEPVESARLALAAMHPLLKLGRVAAAIEAGESAARELVAAGQGDLAARADINLGNVRKAAGQPAEALEHLDRARRALAGDEALVATIDNTRGEALLDLDRFDESREAFASALDHFESNAQSFAAGIVRGNLADLAGRVGSIAEAFEQFSAARTALGDRAGGHVARLAMEESEVFEAVGLIDVAIDRVREARQRFVELGLEFEPLRAAIAEASMLDSMGRLDEAITVLDDVEVAFERLDHAGLRWRRRSMLACLLAERAARDGDTGDRDRAEVIGADAFGSENDGVGLESLRRRLDCSRWHERLGRVEAAVESVEVASRVAQSLGLGVAIAEVETRRAVLLLRTGAVDAAIESARRAVEQVERTRDALGAERLRAAFSGRRLSAYESLVLALVERGGEHAVAEAFEVAEMARSRTLLERLGRRLDAVADESDTGPEVDRLIQRLRGLHAKLALRAREDERSSIDVELRRELASVESDLEHRLSLAAATRAVGGERSTTWGTEGRHWREQLGSDEAIVEYFEAAGRWLAFVATSERIEVRPLDFDASELHETLDRLAFRIRRRLRSGGPPPAPRSVEVGPILTRLGEMLWSPIAELLEDRRRVAIAPHSGLHAVPFAALTVSGRPLVGQHVLSVVPSVRVWSRLRDRGRTRPEGGELLIVGVPDDSAPAVEKEVLEIASTCSAEAPQVLLGADATADRVLERLADPRVDRVHLACHGQFLPEAPHASGLRMFDRWITVRDLGRLARTPRVVVLSGCETGGLAVRRGEEMLGLARTLMSRGSSSVVASLWPISDLGTCELMVDLHRRWSTFDAGTRSPVATALSQVQRDAANSQALGHPAIWSPFIAIGDAR